VPRLVRPGPGRATRFSSCTRPRGPLGCRKFPLGLSPAWGKSLGRTCVRLSCPGPRYGSRWTNYYDRGSCQGVTLEREVGPLQMRILGLLGENTELSVADVQARLATAGNPVAYTTVMTVLARLHERGLVRRERSGKRYVYQAAKRAAATRRASCSACKPRPCSRTSGSDRSPRWSRGS
jgi:predicted transcriptional regulator